jgi:hypothetical protein
MREIVKPHLLRRTKKEIFEVKSAELSEEALKPHELPIKTDLVVWVPLSEI